MAKEVVDLILRNPQDAARSAHDLVIVGGGIYGACLLLEAARRGLKPLLLERDDFGGATSWNSLRIVHGGLRYLQSLDFRRFTQSVRERQWFLDTFSDLIEPLPCVMPLYGEGMKRPSVLRAALQISDLLSMPRGGAMQRRRALPRSRVLNVHETLSVAPHTHLRNLKGAAVWYDGVMKSSQRVTMEIIRWACKLGGTALNYVEARGLIEDRGRVRAVRGLDRITGAELEFSSTAVANCAGPWSREVASSFDREVPGLFQPSLACNLLLDREPVCDAGLAVSPRRRGGQVYFLYPFHGRTLAGTAHWPWTGSANQPRPTHEQVETMLDELSAAIPGFALSHEDVLRVYSGLLPTRIRGSARISTRPEIYVHGAHGGLKGLVSVSGVKFTTARDVAERALRRLFTRHDLREPDNVTRPAPTSTIDLIEPGDLFEADPGRVINAIKSIVHDEAVTCIDDLLLRRTDWLANPRHAHRVTARLHELVDVTDLFAHLPQAQASAVQSRQVSAEKPGSALWLRC